MRSLTGTLQSGKYTMFKKEYKKMLDINRLMAAYELISKNKGANTPGVDSSTLDGINME